jgi:IS4 transposase
MQFSNTVFSGLLEPINRRQFAASVTRHKGDRYAKTLSSWDHLVALLFAQLSGADSLRAISTGFNAQSHQHYHLGARPVARSTLSDANARRAPAIFTDLLSQLIAQLGRKARHKATFDMRLIDSTPIPLSKMFACAAHNGRIHGLKLHVLFDPHTPSPLHTDITAANVNDVSFRGQVPLEAGITYVFDKGYCHYDWWREIHAAGAFFVTRPKTNASWTTLRTRHLNPSQACAEDCFEVLSDQDVINASKGFKAATFKTPMRLIAIKRDDGNTLTLITNDTSRSARDIALSYKERWSIELFFKWVKQNLNLSRFIGRSENAVRLQIIVAMIAFVLIQLARKAVKIPHSTQRFRQLIAALLPTRRSLHNLEKPPPINPPKPKPDPNQTQFQWNY